MKKNLVLASSIFTTVILVILTSLAFNPHLEADQASQPLATNVALVVPLSPQPPDVNPHPPQTEAEKKRVAFAEQAVKLHLMKQAPILIRSEPVFNLNKDIQCLQKTSCYSSDPRYLKDLTKVYKDLGLVVEFRHAHIIPWSWKQYLKSREKMELPKKASRAEKTTIRKSARSIPYQMPKPELEPDEFIVHVYAKSSHEDQWYHVDVILTEDKTGNIYLRSFFAVPMPPEHIEMPPGVVC